MKLQKLAVFFLAGSLAAAGLGGCAGGQKEAATEAAREQQAAESSDGADAAENADGKQQAADGPDGADAAVSDGGKKQTADSSDGADAAANTTGEQQAADGAGYAKDDKSGSNAGEDGATEEDEENYDTGDASLDDPRNQDGIGENELLVVSFGTSFNDNRRLTIGAIENALAKAFPDYDVRRGFTSQIIIDHVRSRDNVTMDNVGEALSRAADNGVKNLVIQPTHLMNGFEYTDLAAEAAEYADAFEHIAMGEPLLTSDEDFQAVITAITEATAEYDDGETAVCFMGHGTEAESNQIYQKMQELLTEASKEHYYIGTVEATPSLDDVLAAVQAGSYKRVVLEPLMIVAGDHANNDMAGDEDSWKTAFEDAGYEVTCLLRGLGELEGIQQLFAKHAQAAMDTLGK